MNTAPDTAGLTKAQRKLLSAMADGWALTSRSAIHGYAHARIAKQGASAIVHRRTLEGLHDRKMVESMGPGPVVAWIRTKLGEKATP